VSLLYTRIQGEGRAPVGAATEGKSGLYRDCAQDSKGHIDLEDLRAADSVEIDPGYEYCLLIPEATPSGTKILKLEIIEEEGRENLARLVEASEGQPRIAYLAGRYAESKGLWFMAIHCYRLSLDHVESTSPSSMLRSRIWP